MRIPLNRLFVILLLLAVTLTSCNRRSQLVYMRNLEVNETFLPQSPPSYRLTRGDVLYIQLLTPSPEASSAFNNPTGVQNANQMRDESSLYLSGYAVNDSGNLELPFLGEVPVVGLTISETRKLLQELAEKHFKEARIKVRYASFKVTVVGEVRRPGNQMNYNDNLTIFEALAQAGDITENGNRKNILVLRPTPDGGKTYRLDLADKSILSSEAYFLLPNDIVFVEPIANKAFLMNVPYISLFFSTVSTAILLINFLF